MTTQLPLNIPAVAKWYDDVADHTASPRCRNSYEECAGCRRLRDKMAQLRVKYADQLVAI